MSRAENDTVLNAEEREIARQLADLSAGEPPPELLERLKADVPEDLAERLAATAEEDDGSAAPRRRRWLAAAAVVVTLVGGGWLAWSVWQVVPPAGERAGRQAAEPSEPIVQQAPAEAAPAPSRRLEQVQEGAEARESDVAALEDEDTASGPPAEESFAEEIVVTGVEAEIDTKSVAAATTHDEALPPPPPTAQAGEMRLREPLRDEAARQAADDRLSTFGLDVDTGSYTALRAALRDGRLPPPAWVRVEEMVNAYRYADPFAAAPPEPGETFRVVAEGAPCPYAPGPRHRLLRFQVTARPVVPVVRRPAEAERAVVEELTGALQTVAEEGRAQVEFDPRTVVRWRLLGYENRAIADERFRWDHAVDTGEIGAGQTVTVLYEVELADPLPAPGRPLALLKLRWRDPGAELFREEETWLRTGDLAVSWQAASEELRLAATVAELGEVLRGSPHAAGLDAVLREARRLAGERPGDGQVAELVELAERAGALRREAAGEPEGEAAP